MDQRGVDAVLAGQFVNRLVPLDRGQGHLRLERRRVSLPRACHLFPLSWTAEGAYCSLIGCPVFGVHYTPWWLRSAASLASGYQTEWGLSISTHKWHGTNQP